MRTFVLRVNILFTRRDALHLPAYETPFHIDVDYLTTLLGQG